MRRKVIRLAGASASTFEALLISRRDAQIERGQAARAGQAAKVHADEKTACGPHWGRYAARLITGCAAGALW